MKMLKLGGCINILIAIAHIICLFNAEYFFEITGIGENMRRNAEIHPLLPYVMTILYLSFSLYLGCTVFQVQAKSKNYLY